MWSLSIFVNNRHSNSDNSERRRFRPSRSKKLKKSPSERRLRKLDAESPICTLEEWWSRAKIPPLPSDDESDQFTWCATPLHHISIPGETRGANRTVRYVSTPSCEATRSATWNAYMFSIASVWISGICRTSSIVRCVIGRILSSSFSRRMSLCGWYDITWFILVQIFCWYGLVLVIFYFVVLGLVCHQLALLVTDAHACACDGRLMIYDHVSWFLVDTLERYPSLLNLPYILHEDPILKQHRYQEIPVNGN